MIKLIGTVSVLAYIMGILYNLVDFSYTQKAIRLTAAIYIITSILSPLQYTDFNIDTDSLLSADYLQQESSDYVISSAAKQVELQIENILNEKNISYTDVLVHINEQSENISIDYIEINGILPEHRQKAESYLSEIGTVYFGE